MKKSIKIIAMLMLIIAIVTFSNNVFAAGQAISPSELTPTYGNDSGLKTKAGQVMGMIRNVSVIAAVIVIMVIGVKYILGSVEEKAEYKKTFMPLIIGIVLVVSATTVAAFIFNMAA